MSNIPIVTIDGPSGSGKGSIGLLVAKELQWHFLDSGAIYRLLALSAMQHAIPLSDTAKLEELAGELNVQFAEDIFLDGKRVTDLIRTETCGEAASKIAVFPKVRTALLARQRAFCKPPGLVADGRDMGTVVFPEAFVKIFLEASAAERAKRRYFQLKDKGENVNLDGLLVEITARDVRDRGRVVAPLKPAKEAVVIDTTGMGMEAVFDRVMQLIAQRLRQ